MYTFVVVRAINPILGSKTDKQGTALWSTEILFSRIKRNDVQLSEVDAVKKLSEISGDISKYITIETNMKSDDQLIDWYFDQVPFVGEDIACCVIASKWNGAKWLRSSESLVVNLNLNFGENKAQVKTGSAFGLDFAYGLDLWTNSSQSFVTSDKLLNGGKLEANLDSNRPKS